MTRSPTGWDRRPATTVSRATSNRLRDDMTPQEVKVWNWLTEILHPIGWKFRRQVRIGPYVADFASLRLKLIIEIDGDDHGLEAGQRRDAVRDAFLRSEGFVVLRFWNNEIGRSGDAFTDMLLGEIEKAGIQPLPDAPRRPSPEGRDPEPRPKRSTSLVKRKRPDP